MLSILKKVLHFFRPRKQKFWLVKCLDPFIPKTPRKVIFIVKPRTIFSANHRVTCEYLAREHPECQIAIFAPGGTPPEISAELSQYNITLFESFSLRYVYYLLRAKVVFISHSIRDSYISKGSSRRVVVNYWHGATYKKIENRMGNLDASKQKLIQKNSKIYHYLVASCKGDQKLMSDSFGIPEERVLPIGLPRYDLLNHYQALFQFSQKTHDFFDSLKAKHEKIIMYAPTFREAAASPLASLPKSFFEEFNDSLISLNYHLVIRPHYYDTTEIPQHLSHISILPHWDHPETNIILSRVDLLIADYSSIWIDFLLTDRPIVFLQLDYEQYNDHERGLNYGQDFLPGEIVTSSQDLTQAITTAIQTDPSEDKRNQVKAYFHDYRQDTDCTAELVHALSEFFPSAGSSKRD